MKFFLFLSVIVSGALAFTHDDTIFGDTVIAAGQMPQLAVDGSGKLNMVYGSGDSILYISSTNGGRTFSKPVLVARLPKLMASHTRGPQIAVTAHGLLITACTTPGNIYAYVKNGPGKWELTGKVNDRDTTAKENLISLAADGDHAFVAWLDLRDGHNKIYGSRSVDGGKTWKKNEMVYASPDKTVCECCKPSVAMSGKNVYIMFRNWLAGNRDLYITRSSDGGQKFTKAEKLGKGSWPLKGCPMDGGGLALNRKGQPETAWNRKGTIYYCQPGKPEQALGQGRSCSIESVNGKNVFAWVDNGEIIVMKPQGIKHNLGKGQLPVLKAVDKELVVCVWENNKQIHVMRLEL